MYYTQPLPRLGYENYEISIRYFSSSSKAFCLSCADMPSFRNFDDEFYLLGVKQPQANIKLFRCFRYKFTHTRSPPFHKGRCRFRANYISRQIIRSILFTLSLYPTARKTFCKGRNTYRGSTVRQYVR